VRGTAAAHSPGQSGAGAANGNDSRPIPDPRASQDPYYAALWGTGPVRGPGPAKALARAGASGAGQGIYLP